MTTDASAKVTVIGGGIIGLAIAWRLHQRGCTVQVVDSEDPGMASHAAAGMLTPVTEAYWGEEALLALTRASMDRWPSFASDLEGAMGHDIGFDGSGVLAVGLDRDDRAVVADLHQLHVNAGLDCRTLTSAELRNLEPALSPGVGGGVFASGDGSVDPRRVIAALEAAVFADGRVARISGRVERLQVTEGRVVGVLIAGTGEMIPTGWVVLAGGSWSALVEGVVPEHLPVRPVFGEVIRLRERRPDHTPRHTIRAVVKGRHVYVVPRRSGEIVIGATSLDCGFETTVTANGVYELLRDAIAVAPGLAEAEWVEAIAGLRPGTPDNAPIIGASTVEGLVYATGHYRNGVLLTPITADAVADLIQGVSLPAVVRDAADPARFALANQGKR